MYTLLVLFFLLSISFSLLCSLWEAVLLSVTPSYVQLQSNNNSTFSSYLKNFKDNIDRPLAAILTLNTIAHTVGAIGVGVQASKIWGEQYPLVTGIVVPVLMTLAILILSEIIPKTIGANFWRQLVPFTVHSLRVIIFLLYPLVALAQVITKALKKDQSMNVLDKPEFLAMAEIGAQQGVFDQDELGIISNLMRFHNIRAEDIMTPRIVVHTAYENMSLQEFHEKNPNLRFSRIPICKTDNKDQVVGYFLKDVLLAELLKGHGTKKVVDIKRDIEIVAEDLPIPKVLSQLMKKKEHIALVVGKFGGMAGVVSVEDVIETLLGIEIVDEFDRIEDMRALARDKWKDRAKEYGLLDAEG
jgi:CBS domain containing-hemolysin-like protein